VAAQAGAQAGAFARARGFVVASTELVAVPFVPEVRLHTATDVTALWRATSESLGDAGRDVPFWSVPWAGGQALARWVLDHPESVRGRRVMDFGTGSGLVAIAAAMAGAKTVRAVDVDAVACAACGVNVEANGLGVGVEPDGGAIEIACDDPIGGDAGASEVILAGDVWYERATSERAERWLTEMARAGVRVLTGDPGRAYAPMELVELATFEVPTPVELESTAMRSVRVGELAAGAGEGPRRARG
jgi:predicted nicotinamide N-methyase